jgi:hypothetical protein
MAYFCGLQEMHDGAHHYMVGKIRAPQSYFLDLASEEVACSSGVLLSDANLKRIAVRYHIEDLKDLSRVEQETVFRAEELEEVIPDVRVAIGNLPDKQMGQFVLIDACRAIAESGGDALKNQRGLSPDCRLRKVPDPHGRSD